MHFQLDHIAYKVPRLDKAGSLLQRKGATCMNMGYFPEVHMHIGFFKYRQHVLELLEPIGAASPIWKDPVGLHHIAIAVADVSKWHRRLCEDNPYFTTQPLRKGRHGDIFFFRVNQDPQWLFECLQTFE